MSMPCFFVLRYLTLNLFGNFKFFREIVTLLIIYTKGCNLPFLVAPHSHNIAKSVIQTLCPI